MRLLMACLFALGLAAGWHAPLHARENPRRTLDQFVTAIREHDCERIRSLVKRQPELLQHLTLGRLQGVIQDGNRETLACLLEVGLTPQTADDNGRTLLHWAVVAQKPELIGLLLEHHADTNALDRFGATPVLLCCLHGTRAELERLVEAGGELGGYDLSGNGAAHFAMMLRGDPDLLQFLLDRQIPLDPANQAGQSPVMLACLEALPQYLGMPCAGNDPAVRTAGVRFLLDHQADVTRVDRSGADLLHYAIRGNRADLVAACIEAGAEVRLKDTTGLTPLDYALLLHTAPELVGLLTHQRAPAPYTDPQGNNHLHMRVAAHWTAPPVAGQLGPADWRTCDPVVPLLLAGGFDPNAVNLAGQTALHRACEGTNLESAKVLLQYGADPNRATLNGVRPLDIAASRHDLDMLRLLLSHNADPLLTDAGGQTALERQLTVGLPGEVRERLSAEHASDGRYQAEVHLLYGAQQSQALTFCWIAVVLGLVGAAHWLRLRTARLKHTQTQPDQGVEPPAALWHGVDWKQRISQFEQARDRHAEQVRLRAWPWLALGAVLAVIGLHRLDPLLANTTPAQWITPFLTAAGICLLMQAGMYWNRRAVRTWLAAIALTAVGVLAALLAFNSYVVAFQMGFWQIGLLCALVLPTLGAAAWAYYRILVIDRAILAYRIPGDLTAAPTPPEPEDIEFNKGWDEKKDLNQET